MRLYGLATPVTLTLTIRHGSTVWIEVSNHEGRFFMNHDGSVYDLVRQVQQGGHWIEEHKAKDVGRTRHT